MPFKTCANIAGEESGGRGGGEKQHIRIFFFSLENQMKSIDLFILMCVSSKGVCFQYCIERKQEQKLTRSMLSRMSDICVSSFSFFLCNITTLSSASFDPSVTLHCK